MLRGKGGYRSDVSELERMVQEDMRDILKENIEGLEQAAEDIQSDAEMLVPLDTGALRASIEVRVSRSPRYPGIIAHASAKDKGFDYAVIQEENEDFEHNKTYYNSKGLAVEEDSGRSAHYLGGPFALHISEFFEDATGEELELPEELEHAKDYIL